MVAARSRISQHRGQGNVLADHRPKRGGEIGAGKALQPLEFGAAQNEVDRAIFGAVQRARCALDAAFDLQAALRRRRRSDWPGDLFSRWRQRRRHRLSRSRSGHEQCTADSSAHGESHRTPTWLCLPVVQHIRGAPSPMKVFESKRSNTGCPGIHPISVNVFLTIIKLSPRRFGCATSDGLPALSVGGLSQ